MPAIVIGADTETGLGIVDALLEPNREVRAFVTDERAGQQMKERGIKVAIGDVSDESHVEAAAARCFTAILVTEATTDSRERSFIDDSSSVVEAWARAVASAEVSRVIWVTSEQPPPSDVAEVAVVDPDEPGLAEKVAVLDEAQSIL